MKRLRHLAELALLWPLFQLFRVLPLDRASTLGGAIGRGLGPLLPLSASATARLRRALPELDETAARAAIRGMWDNLGRVIGEYPHIGDPDLHHRIEVVGAERIEALREAGGGAICFSGHFGNWEVLPVVTGAAGLPLVLVYREANNPYVERLIQRVRRRVPGRHLPKGAAGGRGAVAALAKGERLGLLVDQKMNDGIPVPFFGRPAMTAPALARLALRYRCPVVPGRVERLGGARFRLVVEDPLTLPDSGDREADVLALMTEVNQVLERWIRARPDHWFWLHRRWPD